jgi:hypothetical protein
MSVLLAVARSLIRERGRRASSLVLLGLMVFSGYSFLRSTGRVYDARGIYTSGYVGATVAQGSTWLFAILGFFLTRGSVEDDRRNHVGEILASTPLKRPTYLLGKLVGSVAYLCMLTLVVCLMAAVMQLLYREAPFQPLELAWPFLLFTLPVIVFVSGLALFSEVVPGLRQWPGDVLFVLVLLLNVFKGLSGGSLMWAAIFSYLDTHPNAISSLAPDKVFFWPGPGKPSAMDLLAHPELSASDKVFLWPGMPVDWHVILPRLNWIALGIALTLAASLIFDRFTRGPARPWRLLWWRRTTEPRVSLPLPDALVASLPTVLPVVAPHWMAALTALVAEVRLTLKRRWWYWLGCGALSIAAVVVSEGNLYPFVLPLALLLPIGVIADLGCREHLHGTGELVLCAPRLREWYSVWKWGAGFIVTCLALIGPLFVMAMKGQLSAMVALIVGTGFAVALAVACSIWTGGYRLFEVIYIVLWWVLLSGIGKNAPIWLDYAGAWYGGKNPSVIGLYALLTLGLISLATITTRWQPSQASTTLTEITF